MAKRRKNNEGSVRQVDGDTWECVMDSKYINPKTGNTKRIKRRGKSKQDAIEKTRQALISWEKEFEAGRDTKIKKSTTFGEYMEQYIDEVAAKTLTGSGYHSYVRTMNANFYKFPIAKYQLQMLNKVEFENYFNDIISKKSRKTCSVPIQLCRRCCQWLVDRSLLRENYARQADYQHEIADEYDHNKEEKMKGRKEVFTPEDIEKFYYAYKNNMGEYPVVVLFLLETGMRASEFASLRNSSIDFEENRIDIVETRSVRFKDNNKNNGIEYYVKVPKNKKSRFIIMSELCRECVEYMMEQTKLKCLHNPDDLLYPSFRSGKRRSNSSMEVCFKDLCNKLDIDRDIRPTKTGQMKGLCLHSLRHTADTIANTAKGANVINTALMMGHTAIRTENVYTHATAEALGSVTTPSRAILPEYKEQPEKKNMAEMSDEDKEMYAMFLKLKKKYEN